MRRKWICVLPLLAALFGCGKSSTPPPTAAASSPSISSNSALRIHWQGKTKISANGNAADLLKILDLPETLKLQDQTLDKLSTAPWRLLLGQTNLTSARLFRPLLDDLVSQECYLEIRPATNAPGAPNQIIFSVNVNADRANSWQSTMTEIMRTLSADAPASNNPAGWFVKSDSRTNFIEFTHAGDWVILSLAQTHSGLLDEAIDRIKTQHTPVPASSTNAFLQAFVDFARFGIQGSSNTLPKCSFEFKFDGASVATTGEIQFPNGDPATLEPWHIPTNWISANAVSITAIRGLAPFLQSSKFWANFNAGSPPDQCFVWADKEFPMQTFLAAPMANASDAATGISNWALRREGTPRLANALAGFQKSKTSDGLSWQGFPFFAPFVHSTTLDGRNFLVAGFLEADIPPGPPMAGVIEGISSKTNLVYFDRELTGFHLEQWIQLGQALRAVFNAGQLTGDSASFKWLVALGPRLGPSGTEITEEAPGKLSFARKSDLGFTAIELHALADWLESPDFPRGTYSVLVRSQEPPL